jgi:MFS family permease
VARPVGAVLFGHMGDRLGRKTAFALALGLMGLATTLIAFVPSYQRVGAFAPLALVILRLTQGLALGGQWGGATLMATENAPITRRGFYGGISQAGVPVGVVLANLSLLIANASMTPATFMAYGWRIPFVLSIVLVGLGLYIHFRLEDTVAFRRAQQTRLLTQKQQPADAPGSPRSSPVLEALRCHPRSILTAAGTYLSSTLCFYILIAYVVAYGTSAQGLALPRSTLLIAVLIAHVIRIPCDILSGSWSDRFGRRRIFMAGLLLMTAWAFVLFPLIETRSALWITAATCIGSLSISLAYGPMAAMFAELFSTRVRYSAASLAYQLGAISGGGLAPIIATALYQRYHSNLLISFYIASACVLSLVCASMLKETHRTDLNEQTDATLTDAVHT